MKRRNLIKGLATGAGALMLFRASGNGLFSDLITGEAKNQPGIACHFT